MNALHITLNMSRADGLVDLVVPVARKNAKPCRRTCFAVLPVTAEASHAGCQKRSKNRRGLTQFHTQTHAPAPEPCSSCWLLPSHPAWVLAERLDLATKG